MEQIYSGPVDPDVLRTFPTSECALRLIEQLAKGAQVNSNNTFRGAEQAWARSGEPDVPQLLNRLSDAWAWLEANGCLGPDPRQAGGWQRLTERGRGLADDANGITRIEAENRLSLSLHSALESKVRPIFLLGDYETAAFSAMKAVEVRVRDLADASDSDLGVKLMHSSFKTGGPLTDAEAEGGEQVATMNLFAGAIGTFKNPASHRTVAYDDPTEAAETVLLADLLMRMLDRVEARTRKETG